VSKLNTQWAGHASTLVEEEAKGKT
jgi:hypothetical protein